MTYRLRSGESTALDLAGGANQTRAWLGQLQGQLASAGPSGDALKTALQGLATTLDAIIAAKGKAAIVASDPTTVAEYKLSKVKALVGDAFGDATRAVLNLASAMDKAREQLANSIMPSKPPTDTSLVAFQADQCAKLLEAAGERGAVVKAAAQLLKDALASGDATLAYVVAGGPLKITYQRLGVNMPMLYQAFAEALGAANAQSAAPGAALLPFLTAGGSGTLRGLVDAVRIAITREQGSYNAWAQQAYNLGQLRGIWG